MADSVQPRFIRLDSVASTNTELARIAASMPHATVLATRRQTAGRGQRGNCWESEPDANITLSILLRPSFVSAREQFLVSEMVSVAVVETLRLYIPEQFEVSVKWPNDIYVGDKKICGILIENVISGLSIERSIAGIGLNVNQEHFLSDAPNPVSLFNIIGEQTSLDEMEMTLCRSVIDTVASYDYPAEFARLHSRYCSMLWRRDGLYPYRDAATGDIFMASIGSVAPSGHISLVDSSGATRIYAFKEVVALLE